jgi:hypothetical protein
MRGRVVGFVLLPVTALLVAALLVYAGYQGSGPLSSLGVEVRQVEPTGYRLLGEGGEPKVIVVVVDWPEDGFCSGQFSVPVTQSDDEVRVGIVTSREHRNGSCAGLGTVDGTAGVDVMLDEPLGDRVVVRASDGAALPDLTTTG